MLISCHIPKTAGVSFATALGEVFGDRFLWDKSCATVIEAMNRDNRVPLDSVPVRWLDQYERPNLRGLRCVHGHFPLRKYLPLAFDLANVFVVWLREPLERQISQYYYWKQCYPHPTEKFLNRVFDENWDIERFCLDPTFANYQSRYLAWFPWWRINFVGVTENYSSDLEYFSRHVLHHEMALRRENVTKKAEASPNESFSSRFLRQFESNNRVDFRYYRRARRISNARRNKEAVTS